MTDEHVGLRSFKATHTLIYHKFIFQDVTIQR